MSKDKELTWDEVATLYDRHHGGRKARTLPMGEVLKWLIDAKIVRVLPNDSVTLA